MRHRPLLLSPAFKLMTYYALARRHVEERADSASGELNIKPRVTVNDCNDPLICGIDDVVAGLTNQEERGSVLRPLQALEALSVRVHGRVIGGAPTAITVDLDTLDGCPSCWRDFEDGAKQVYVTTGVAGGAGAGAGVGTIGAVGERPAPSQADKRTAEIKTTDRPFITLSLCRPSQRMSFQSRTCACHAGGRRSALRMTR